MTVSDDTTTASAIPRRGFLRGASVVAMAMPAAAAAMTAATGVLQKLIDAHTAAYDALGPVSIALEHAEDDASRSREPVPTVASFKRSYDSTHGRAEILKRIADDFESAAARMRKSYMAELLSQSEIEGAIARLDALGREAMADARRFFDEEEASVREAPLGRAKRAWKAALQVEDAAYVAVLAHRCRSTAEAEQKALYIAGSENFQASAPEEHHFDALVKSALPVVSA